MTLTILVKKKRKKKNGGAWSCTSGIRNLLLKGPQNGLKYFKPSNCRKEATIFIKTIAC